MSQQEDILANFIGITGIDAEHARGYLEAANWDLAIASALFYEGQQEEIEAAPVPAAQSKASPVSATPSARQAPQPSLTNPAKKTKVASQPSGGVRTLADLGRGDDSDEDEDDEENTYYAGGEKSGIQVKAAPSAESVARKMAEAAQRQQAEAQAQASGEKKKPAANFGGSGYRLGSVPDEDRSNPSTGVKSAMKEASEPSEVTRTVTLYRNGFVVEDGPLRGLDDPVNLRFLEDMYRGIIPAELEREAGTALMNMNFADKRGEDYVPPKVSPKPFTGQGYSLGSSTSTSVTPSAPASTPTFSPYQLTVDPTKPTTSLQIRLHDGTRLVARFNHDHKVSDVRHFIEAAKPIGRSFSLMTPPRTPIVDDTKTLAEAGLLNSVVVQSL